jgi:6,7-dimethyl-8-ribityllumazine synthase
MKNTDATTKSRASGERGRRAAPAPRAAGQRIAIIASTYHGDVTGALLEGARQAHRAAGGAPEDLRVIAAPGAFELPVLAAAAAARADIAGVVALGCVVRGETRHDRYICAAVAAELARLAVDRGKPVGFGVLTVETMRQARARAGGKAGNKGAEAMEAVLRALAALAEIRGAAADGRGA